MVADGEHEGAPGIEEAFGLVAHDVRAGILWTLWEHERGDDRGPLSFSGLHDAADVRDSGQFNYHLDKLTPRFVREVDGGYELTYAGERVIGAATSGSYTWADSVSVAPTPVGDCPECGGSLVVTYEGGYVEVACEGCGLTVLRVAVPPVLAAGYDAEELPVAFSRYTLTQLQELDRGFCPRCGGRVDATLDRTTGEEPGGPDDQRLMVVHTCRECGDSPRSVIGAAVIDHPAVIWFLYEHGMDIRTTPLWELDPLFGATGRVTAENPRRVEVELAAGEAALTLTLDADLAVVEHARTKP